MLLRRRLTVECPKLVEGVVPRLNLDWLGCAAGDRGCSIISQKQRLALNTWEAGPRIKDAKSEAIPMLRAALCCQWCNVLKHSRRRGSRGLEQLVEQVAGDQSQDHICGRI